MRTQKVALFLVLSSLCFGYAQSIGDLKEDIQGDDKSLNNRFKKSSSRKVSGYFSRIFDLKLVNETEHVDYTEDEVTESQVDLFKNWINPGSRRAKKSIKGLHHTGLTDHEILGFLSSGSSGARHTDEFQPHQYTGRILLSLHNANILLRVKHPGVTCKPISMCQVVYGTNPQHFVDFGFVSPEENSCHSTSNLVLCVQPQSTPGVTKPPVTKPTVTKPPVYITTNPVALPPVTKPPVYINPNPIPATQAPIPVTQAPITVTQAPVQVNPVLPTEQGFPTFGQGISGQPPFPYYNNVQIIGPKPIYITYNNVVGPSVTNNYGNSKKKMRNMTSNINNVDKTLTNYVDDEHNVQEHSDLEQPQVSIQDGRVHAIHQVLNGHDDSSRKDILSQAVDLFRIPPWSNQQLNN